MQSNQAIQSVAILANPKAGSGNGVKTAKWLSDKLLSLSIKHTIYTNAWPSETAINEYSDAWIIGGDGTINYFINLYPNCQLNLALFNGGTGNDFAWKLYKDTQLEERFYQVVNASPSKIDTGIVNDKLYINCMGVGFDGEIIQSMKAIRFLGGHIGYLLAVLLKIISFKAPRLKIETEKQTWDDKFLLALFVNSSRAGGGFYIAPSAQINDGYLDMVLCEALPIWKRLIYLPIIKSGKHMHLPFVKHSLGNTFKISCTRIMPIQVDGELIFAKDIQVNVLARKFNFRY